MTDKFEKEKDGFIRVFRRYIVKNGRRVYPKRGKAFTFLVQEVR